MQSKTQNLSDAFSIHKQINKNIGHSIKNLKNAVKSAKIIRFLNPQTIQQNQKPGSVSQKQSKLSPEPCKKKSGRRTLGSRPKPNTARLWSRGRQPCLARDVKKDSNYPNNIASPNWARNTIVILSTGVHGFD